jgi:hypothetical protein
MSQKDYEAELAWDSPDWLLRQWLTHSYLYYVHDQSVLPDPVYDAMCKRLLKFLKEGHQFRNQGYAHEGRLVAGTAFDIPADKYPGAARYAALAILLREGLELKPHPPYNPDYDPKGECMLTEEYNQ